MLFSSKKAKRQLDYEARPAIMAFEDAIDWFHNQGYLARGRTPETLSRNETR
jgi:hypothetical protein